MSERTRIAPSTFLVAAAALWLLSTGVFASTAQADFCSGEGASAGECEEPFGVAADWESGRHYVVEQANERVSAFDADGSFAFAFGWGVVNGAAELQKCTTVSGCEIGLRGSGAGQFDRPTAIAVDNTGGANQGDVYVYDGRNGRVHRFEEEGGLLGAIEAGGECELNSIAFPNVAVGPGGLVHVAVSESGANTSVSKFEPSGGCVESVELETTNRARGGLGVDSEGSLYVALVGFGGITKFPPSGGAPLFTVDEGVQTNAIAIGEGDRIFGSQLEPRFFEGGVHQVIAEYDATGETQRRFGYDVLERNARGLAHHESAFGDVAISQDDRAVVGYLDIPPPAPVTVPSSVEVIDIGATKATIRAEVNPEGSETEARIQYVDEQSYEEDKEEGGDGFEGSGVKEGPPTSIPSGFGVQGAEALAGCEEIEEGECLLPETAYRFRVIATNADGTSEVEGPPFETNPHLQAFWAQGVGTDTARLGISADPYGVPTTGYVQYVSEQGFEESGFEGATKLPATGELDFGEGEGPLTRTVSLHSLAEGTAYRYRAVVADQLSTETGEAKAFATFAAEEPTGGCANDALRSATAAFLPDCRAYEMVSPLDKDGGEIKVQLEETTNLPATLDQAATSGERLTYGSYRAFGEAESAPYTVQYLAARGGSGWQSHGISPPLDGILTGKVELKNEYQYFSAGLCKGWLTPFLEVGTNAGQVPGYRDIYARELCGSEDLDALIATQPENQDPADYTVELQGVSADGQTVAFAADDSLEGSEAPNNTEGKQQLYVKEQGGAGPRFACVLPEGGGPSEGRCSAGTSVGFGFGNGRLANVERALSSDGRRLYWTDSDKDGPIYVRLNPLSEAAECSGEGAPCTVAVSADGEAASGTSASRFLAGSSDGQAAIYLTGEDLYRFELASGESTPIAGEVPGIVGASEDAERVYLVSREALDPEPNERGQSAAAGEPNLYLYEAAADAHRFVATLAEADANAEPTGSFERSSAVALQPRRHNGRASADGSHAAFMSAASLTGYDNADAASGEPDTEAFVYDAGAERLICASCNPSGGRPSGVDAGREASPFWIAARLPVYENSLYAPRVLSADGSRLYFEAADRLVARDTNSRIDVYQWQQAGAGSCETSSPTYSEQNRGCIDLISSGQSSLDAGFVDASPSGDDVFFTTLASLYAADFGLADVYDARVGGGFAPPPAPSPECQGEACQSPQPAPEPQTPASLPYSGPGDLAAPSASRASRCNRPARRARKLSERAKRLRRAARGAKAPAARRKRSRAARRSGRSARRLSRNAKRCRARARAPRRSQR